MGKGKKSQNDTEVLGQIFDFIFKEAKKPIDKRRPIKLKPTGISTSHELVDGLAAALEQPGVYVSDKMLESMNRALTVEFGSLNANESGTESAKFTTTSLAKFLSDPNSFLSKPKEAAKMSMRDVMKAAFLGRIHQGLVTNGVAHKYNFDLDAKKAILGHYQAEKTGREAEAGRAFATSAGAIASGKDDSSRMNYVSSRNADLIGKEMFGRSGWEAMSEEKKIGLQKAIIRGNDAVADYMDKTYTGSSAKWGDEALSRYLTLQELFKTKEFKDKKANVSPKGGVDVFDVNNYNLLEMRNLTGRMDEMELYLKRHPGLSINEKARIQEGIQQLGQAAVVVSGSHLDLKDVAVAKKELNQRVSDCKSELLLAKRTGDKDKIRYYNSEIKKLKAGDRQLSGMQFWGKIGEYEGIVDSLKDVFGEGLAPNAISSILDGSFYDKKRNIDFLLPNDDPKVSFSTHKWKIKDEEGKLQPIEYKEEIKIFTAKHTGNKLRDSYNVLMTNLYYITPQSILRSLFVNGEGFVYLAQMRAAGAAEKLKAIDEKFDFERLLKGDKAYIAKLNSVGIKGADLGGIKVAGKMAQIFSFGQRKRDLAKAWLDEHLYKKMRQQVYKRLIGRMVDKEAKALLEKWLMKGGMEVIGKALAITILNAIGIAATGGLGSFLMPIISSIVVDVLYASAKVLIQFLLIVVAGVIGLVWYGMDKGKNNFDSQAYAYTNVVPGEVVSNPNFKGTSPIVGEDDDPIDDFIGGTLPDGQRCLLNSSSIHCSQGAFGSYSHANVAAIDLSSGASDFFAPQFCGNNNCVVTFNGTTSCTLGSAGGMIIFTAAYGGTTYEFKLIHVKAASGIGVGTKLNAGQQVARVMPYGPETSACSSGTHLHLQTKVNGSAVDPWQVMTSNPSNGGFGCNISVCDP